MARRAVTDRRKRIVDHLARMLIQYLQTHVFKDMTDVEMSDRVGVSISVLTLPWWTDIPEICEAASLDIGLAIRDRKGNEVTLWPADNFASGYKPLKAAAKESPTQVGFRANKR